MVKIYRKAAKVAKGRGGGGRWRGFGKTSLNVEVRRGWGVMMKSEVNRAYRKGAKVTEERGGGGGLGELGKNFVYRGGAAVAEGGGE